MKMLVGGGGGGRWWCSFVCVLGGLLKNGDVKGEGIKSG